MRLVVCCLAEPIVSDHHSSFLSTFFSFAFPMWQSKVSHLMMLHSASYYRTHMHASKQEVPIHFKKKKKGLRTQSSMLSRLLISIYMIFLDKQVILLCVHYKGDSPLYIHNRKVYTMNEIIQPSDSYYRCKLMTA